MTVDGYRHSGFCDLCRTAWEQKNNMVVHDMPAIPDLQSWWYGAREAGGRRETADGKRSNVEGWVDSSVCLLNDRPELDNLEWGRRKGRSVGEKRVGLVSDIFTNK